MSKFKHAIRHCVTPRDQLLKCNVKEVQKRLGIPLVHCKSRQVDIATYTYTYSVCCPGSGHMSLKEEGV